jgi:hypothetical protein
MLARRVRSLLAFSLVLIFVCLGAFLYNSVNSNPLTPGGRSAHITESQLSELKTQFVVAYEPARNANGSVETDTDGKSPLYNATYFVKSNKDAEDFAKQIFTTLATVFVSVISFYFGSSTTSSAVGAGVKAAGGGGSGTTPSGAGTTAGGGGTSLSGAGTTAGASGTTPSGAGTTAEAGDVLPSPSRD